MSTTVVALGVAAPILFAIVICFFYCLGEGIWTFIKCVRSLCECDEASSPTTQPPQGDVSRPTHTQHEPRAALGSTAASTEDVAVLNVETLEHILSQSRGNTGTGRYMTTITSEGRHVQKPSHGRVYELPGHGRGKQLATMPCMPTCVICQDRKCDCCIDCGHLFCTACAVEVGERDRSCPVCRELFKYIWRIYPDNSFTNNWVGTSQTSRSRRPICVTGICTGLDCDSCLSCGHLICYVCACQLQETGSKCHVCHKTFTSIRRIYY